MIDEITKQLKPLINGKLIYLSQYGSHLYGLNTENSDLDFRGVYIPTLDDIILKKDKDEINTELEVVEHIGAKCYFDDALQHHCEPVYEKKKVDVKIFSLQKFIQLCSKADTNALDLLFSCHKNYAFKDEQSHVEQYYAEPIAVMPYIRSEVSKLINTDRLESPITYAFKQATKYGIKGNRYKVFLEVLDRIEKFCPNVEHRKTFNVSIMEGMIHGLDPDYVRIETLDNKGTEEQYLFVCGVYHQFNLSLDKFEARIREKVEKEYTSQRTIDAANGNDWKALSHAIRVLLEIKELLDTGNIQFPLKDKEFLLDIKQGKVKREFIDNFFNQELSNILERVQKNELDWKYDEEFWNEFILKEVKANV